MEARICAQAARRVLDEHGLTPGDLDLIVLGSARYELLQPADAHAVAELLGASCPVFDVKNGAETLPTATACAEALIAAGRYRRVLVCGETTARLLDHPGTAAPPAYARLAGVAMHLPERVESTAEVEERIAAASPAFRPTPAIIERTTGIRARHVAAPGETAADLAVAASRKLLAEHAVAPGDLDLVIGGSAWVEDLESVAAREVADRLGAGCPAFDVKNACAGFLNGVELAEAFVASGRHRRVLVCTGESWSRNLRWELSGREEFRLRLGHYIMGDGAGAILVEAAAEPGITHVGFDAESRLWRAGAVPARRGGPARRLVGAFTTADLDGVLTRLDDRRVDWDRFAVICVHQPTRNSARHLTSRLRLPDDRLLSLTAGHGHLGAATLPVQLATAVREGRCGPGDEIALIAFSTGLSLGAVFARL